MASLIAFFCCLFWYIGVQELPLADAITLTMIAPILTLLLGVYYLNEKVSGKHIIFFLLGFLGVIFISKPPFITCFFV